MTAGDPNDHDLLIRVDEKINNLQKEFASLRNDSFERILKLETTKLDTKNFDDHKKDYDATIKVLFKNDDTIKKYMYIGMGIVITLQFVALIVASTNKP